MLINKDLYDILINLNEYANANYNKDQKRDYLGRWAKMPNLDNITPVEFSFEEYNKFKENGSVLKHCKEYLYHKKVNHPLLGDIIIIPDGITESINKNRPKNFYILTKSDQIIEKSLYAYTEDLKHERKDEISKFHILHGKIKLGNKIKTVQTKIAEMPDGRKFYLLRTRQLK